MALATLDGFCQERREDHQQSFSMTDEDLSSRRMSFQPNARFDRAADANGKRLAS
jgi:hypothetical protein